MLRCLLECNKEIKAQMAEQNSGPRDALGGRMDGQVTDERVYNLDWNPIWVVKGGRFDSKYPITVPNTEPAGTVSGAQR